MAYRAAYTPEPMKPSGGPQAGTLTLQRWIIDSFDAADNVDDQDPVNLGIYNPRDVCGNIWPHWECSGSQHARGAAGDVGFPVTEEGHPEGYKLAGWLVTEHLNLGIQEVIWARRRWSNVTLTWKPYTGRSPHLDHVHWAQSAVAAALLTTREIEAAATRLTPESPPSLPPPPLTPLETVMFIWVITDRPGAFFLQMPDGLVRLTAAEAFRYGSGGTPNVEVTEADFKKASFGKRAVSFNDPPPMEVR